MAKFILKEEHIKLIQELNFRCAVLCNDGHETEYVPAIDGKRPFGNSGVTYDAMSKLGLLDCNGEYSEADQDHAEQLLIELPVALEIITRNKTFIPGEYEVDAYGAYFDYKGKKNLHFWKKAIRKFSEDYPNTDRVTTICMNCFDENPYAVLKSLKDWNITYLDMAYATFQNYAVDDWISKHQEKDMQKYYVDGAFSREALADALECGAEDCS